MAALGGRVNGIICHANQGREHACPLDVMSLLADMTAANSPVFPPFRAMPTGLSPRGCLTNMQSLDCNWGISLIYSTIKMG